MDPLEIGITALISALVGAGVAYPIGRRSERNDVRRQAAKAIDTELAEVDSHLKDREDWTEPYNQILDIRNRHEFALRHDELERRLDALTSLTYMLWSDLNEHDAAKGHCSAYVRRAIRSVRNGANDFLHHRKLRQGTFPTGDTLERGLKQWREDGVAPREWLEPER